MKPELLSLAQQVELLCRLHNITLTVGWIPRESNCFADYYSRVTDTDDWAIHPHLFSMLETMWGPHTVDRFANNTNAKLSRFNARFACPGAEAFDAFLQNWTDENNYLVPPPCLIKAVIDKLIKCRASGTLVAPHWPSSPFWPVLFPQGRPAFFVKDQITFQDGQRYLLPGSQPHSVLGTSKFRNALIALRLNASLPPSNS